MVLANFHQWSTADKWASALQPSWVGDLDANRLAAYNLYEQIYWNVPEAFTVVQRGSDTQPIYVPSGKKIVETLHRYLAKGMTFVPVEGVTDEAQRLLNQFLARERFFSKFSAAKRYGIIRGDWLIHMYADPTLPEGSRISVEFVDPAMYFPIYNPDNVDEVIGCHLASQVELEDGTFIERLTYRKETETGGPSPITRMKAYFEVDEWGGPGMEEGQPTSVILPEERLPDPIDALPIYHIRNFQQDGTPWGSSELRGFEILIGGINQGISDEDLALALEALGVYVTDSGRPINETTGEEEPWNLGPGRVVEVADGKNFDRVEGISSVTPYQDHLKALERWMDMGSGTPAVAVGDIDAQTAESGVALELRLAPIIDRAEEKDDIIKGTMDNWLFDVRKWFLAYEGAIAGPMAEAVWVAEFGGKMPLNRKQRFKEILEMATSDPPMVSMQWARTEVAALGYEFPDDTEMMDQIIMEQTILSQIKDDVTGARMDQELEEDEPSPNGQVTEEVEV